MSVWRLEAAKAKLGEVVRQARSEGPQTITVRGEQAVIILSVEAYAQLGGQPQGIALIGEEAVFALSPAEPAQPRGAPPGETWVDRLRESVIGDIDIERSRDTGRDFEL